jgi:hypothetical protein
METHLTADLILTNANIITLDPVRPRAELLSIQDGKILIVGSRGDLKELRHGKTEVVDCRGKTVLPGFIDPHLHFHGYAESLVTLNLEPWSNVRSISDIQKRIRQFSQEVPSGAWIRGRGYNEFYLDEKRHPTRWDLDAAAPLHPVKVAHRSGHAHVLNSLALKLVDISKETGDPPEGLIDRDIVTGEPTGLLYGMGDYLAQRIPPILSDQMELGVKRLNGELCSLGITSFQDASPRNDLNRWNMFRHWKEAGLLKTRVSMALGVKGFKEYHQSDFRTEVDENQLNLRGVKVIVHETTGTLRPGQDELNGLVLDIHRSGLQAILHAIEERTIEAACIATEFSLGKHPGPDHRHRIEHCSVCSPSLAKRISSLGMTVVTQPSFIYYNGDRYLKTVPATNLRHLYPISTLKKNGVRVAGSSDGPVVPSNPIPGIYSAISRKTESGEILLPEEAITPMEAIKMYTVDAAKAIFEERVKGSLEPGKLADLVVLNGDPTRIPIDEIKDLRVEMTILGGEVVWEKM